jgi:hypothetical protein
MKLDQYPVRSAPDSFSFEFWSEGPKGKIRKVIQFNRLYAPGSLDEIYNLGFGDFSPENDKINDLIVSNNKDAEKILATVASTVASFTLKHPDAAVFAQGSTPSRTRFYIMGISKHLKQILAEFEIWGLNYEEWELFQEGPALFSDIGEA